MKTRIYAAAAVKGLNPASIKLSPLSWLSTDIRLYMAIPQWITGLKVTYHPLYSMNKFVTNKSKLPQDGAQVFPYMG